MLGTKDVTVLEDELVRAVADPPPECVATGPIVRCVIILTNIDFLYIFDQPIGEKVQKIKEALQRGLAHYSTLAGRVAEDGVSVHLNNRGASFRVQQASPNHSIYDIPDDPPTGPPYCYIPSPGEQIRGKASLLTVTITKFRNGWTLGVVMSHLVADAWTFSMFMKDWSILYNGKSLECPVQVHLPDVVTQACSTKAEMEEAAERLGERPCRWGKRLFLNFLYRYALPMMLSKRDPRIGSVPDRILIHYSDLQAQRLKAQFLEQAGPDTPWVSTNEALIAHIWKLLLDAADLQESKRKCLGVLIPVNLRGKLPGVDDRLAGNVVALTSVPLDMTDNANEPLAKRLHDEMRAALVPKRLVLLQRFLNAMWKEEGDFGFHECKKGDFVSGTFGNLQMWNWQGSNPFFCVDFGTGLPLRGILWSWNNPVTVVRGVKGGLDVYIDTSSRGPVQWREVKKKWWLRASRILGIATATVSLALATSGPGRRQSSIIWLVTCGLLYKGASSRAKHDIDESKRAFCEYIRSNSHAFVGK